jgi:phenylalanyl-tRNA synthetase alpha chain
MEGVRIFPDDAFPTDMPIAERKKVIEKDLKGVLTGLARHLFGDVEMRWREDYFPFTEPSFELEVMFNGNWMEVLGCGVVHDDVIRNAGLPAHRCGWAFGLGLERLAMVLFSIPDIRLFWTADERFLSQFKAGEIVRFQPYSKHPHCYKDVSFWLPSSELHPNDVYEVRRPCTTR